MVLRYGDSQTIGDDIVIDGKIKDFFCRRVVKQGYCLRHARAIRRMQDATGFMLCQGPLLIDPIRGCLQVPYLHCWIENDDTVIDLTMQPHFFLKSEYYVARGVVLDQVKRYTQAETVRMRRIAGSDHFWEFDLLRYQFRL